MDGDPRTNSTLWFGRRLGLFLAPLLLLIALLEVFLWWSGEIWPLEKVVEYQARRRDATFLRALMDQSIFRYKFLVMCQRRPKVLVIGSSRVGKFRSQMFGVDGENFYNASLLVGSIADLEYFLDHFPVDYHPKVILLNIDPWWLNEHYWERSPAALTRALSSEAASDWKAHLTALRRLVTVPRVFFSNAEGAMLRPRVAFGQAELSGPQH